MKENELRVGVYIYYCEEVFEVDAECIKMHMGDDLDDAYRPIPLTEEWLLKFGFEIVLNQYKKITDVSKDTFKNIPFIILFLDNQFQYDDLRFRTNLQYVHQLQNLYFALTGEELTSNN
jgi:hypothetical protein